MSSGALRMDWKIEELVVAGGAFGGAFAAIGKGLSWLVGLADRRHARREKQLDEWQGSLTRREKEYREAIEERLGALDAELGKVRADLTASAEREAVLARKVRGLRRVSVELVVELEAQAPGTAAAVRAANYLREAFPLDFDMPADLADLARQLGEME